MTVPRLRAGRPSASPAKLVRSTPVGLAVRCPDAPRCSQIPNAAGTPPLASHSRRASADGSASMTDGGSCNAHTVNTCPARAAGSSDLRDHAVRLKNNGRRCHRLRRYCKRQGETSNSNQPDHSVPPLTVRSLQPLSVGSPVLMFKQHKLPALVARRLEIDQGIDRLKMAQIAAVRG